jgi:hypothetical protein
MNGGVVGLQCRPNDLGGASAGGCNLARDHHLGEHDRLKDEEVVAVVGNSAR